MRTRGMLSVLFCGLAWGVIAWGAIPPEIKWVAGPPRAGGGMAKSSAIASPLRSDGTPRTSVGFQPPVTYWIEEDSFTAQVAVADFNGDGFPDLAVANGNDSVSVLMNRGNGTFDVTSYYVYGDTEGIVAGDFNRDGKPDLVISGLEYPPGMRWVLVVLGNGDGTFNPAHAYHGSYPGFLVAADFNRDGRLDIAGLWGEGVHVMLGNGDGTFGQPAFFSDGPFAGSPNEVWLATGDFNLDGRVDLVLAKHTSGTACVLTGNGDGTFRPPVEWPVNTSGKAWAEQVVVGDLNGDGRPDLAVVGFVNVTQGNQSSVTVLLGNGDGTFQAPRTYLLDAAVEIALGDVDGDGKLDLIVFAYGAFNVLLGNGDGSFRLPATYPGAPGSLDGVVVAADFDGDGTLDVAAAASRVVSVILGGAVSGLTVAQTRTGAFIAGGSAAAYLLTVSNAGTGEVWGTVRVEDVLPAGFSALAMEGEGWSCNLKQVACNRSDPLAPGASYPPISLRVSVGGNVSGNVTNTATVFPGGRSSSDGASVADIEPVLLATATSLSAAPAPATLGAPVTLTATVSPTATGRVAFFDGTRPLGVALLDSGRAILTSLLPAGKRTLKAEYMGNSAYGPSTGHAVLVVAAAAAGAFQPAVTIALSQGAHPGYVAVGDFNRDGRPDIVTANFGTNDLSVLLGNGDGTLRSPVNYPAGTGVSQVEVADFDGDGNPDLVVLAAGAVSVLLGNGDGTFQPALPFQASNISNPKMLIADFNGDGVADLLCHGEDGFRVFLGLGDGTLRSLPASALRVYESTVTDVDGDGIPDLVGAGNKGPVVFLGRGDGTFALGAADNWCCVYPVSVEDFDRDGNNDLLVFDPGWAVRMYPGSQGWTSAPPASATSLHGRSPVEVSDMDGDGSPDLVEAEYLDATTTGVVVWLGDGDGTFRRGAAAITPVLIKKIALADLNGDGRSDLACVGQDLDGVLVFLGRFTGLTVSSTHAGVFEAGSEGQTYQITVGNPGSSPTAGLVTMADTLPAGFRATAIGGTGWDCDLSSVTCTRSDALAPGSSYPPITLTVEVSAAVGVNSAANIVSVENAGITSTAADPTTFTALTVSAVVNAASRAPSASVSPTGRTYGKFAPNTIVSALGTFPGCNTPAEVRVGDTAATVFYSSPTEVIFLVPETVVTWQTATHISCAGLSSREFRLVVESVAPGVFTVAGTGSGPALSVNSNGLIGGPVRLGTEVTVFGTGFGRYGAPGPDGVPRLQDPVIVTVGGVAAEVTYAGAAPGATPGLQEIRFRVPTVVQMGDWQESPLQVGAAQPNLTLLLTQ
jgi:uncharacterized protein (TIGR03437 family)